MTISRATAIRNYFDDPENGSPKPTMKEMKALIADKEAYEEMAQLAAIELGEELADKEAKANAS